MATWNDQIHRQPNAESYGAPNQLQKSNPGEEDSSFNDILKMQKNPLSLLAHGLSSTDRNSGDLEMLKDHLSDVVADAIVRYKSNKASPVSQSMLQNTNSIYRNVFSKGGFQGRSPASGKQYALIDASRQKQTPSAKGNTAKGSYAKIGSMNGVDKVKINALWQPLLNSNVMKEKQVAGLKEQPKGKFTDVDKLRPVGNSDDVNADITKGKHIGKDRADHFDGNLKLSNDYSDDEVADDGTTSDGDFGKFKGENPNGAVYKERQESRKKRPEYDENIYSNFAGRSNEPDFPEGLLPAGEIKEGLSDLLDWSIPPTATAFSGMISHAQVDGPSLFKLHGNKEREYFSKEGEDDQNDLDLLLPRKQSQEMFLRDPGKSLPGETLIENSNFDQVRSTLREDSNIKNPEKNLAYMKGGIGSSSERRLAKNSQKKSTVGKRHRGWRRYPQGHHSHRHHHHRNRGRKHRVRKRYPKKWKNYKRRDSEMLRFPKMSGVYFLKKKK